MFNVSKLNWPEEWKNALSGLLSSNKTFHRFTKFILFLILHLAPLLSQRSNTPCVAEQMNRHQHYQKPRWWCPSSGQVVCTSWGRGTLPSLYLKRKSLFSPKPGKPWHVIKTTADTLEQLVKPRYHLWELFNSDQLETAGNRACDLAEGNKTVRELLNVMLTHKLLEAALKHER